MVTYLVVNGISRAFRPAGLGEATPGVQARQAAGKAGCALFLYLEVLDAAFSFDGVTGAFAITTDPIIIALGLGVVGAMFVRSITIYLVRQDTLDRYVYLEHGAHWAIGALAIILLLSIDHRFAVPEWVTASVGWFLSGRRSPSVRRNRLTVRSPRSSDHDRRRVPRRGAGALSPNQCVPALKRSTERCTSASASARSTQSAALTNLPGSRSL